MYAWVCMYVCVFKCSTHFKIWPLSLQPPDILLVTHDQNLSIRVTDIWAYELRARASPCMYYNTSSDVCMYVWISLGYKVWDLHHRTLVGMIARQPSVSTPLGHVIRKRYVCMYVYCMYAYLQVRGTWVCSLWVVDNDRNLLVIYEWYELTQRQGFHECTLASINYAIKHVSPSHTDPLIQTLSYRMHESLTLVDDINTDFLSITWFLCFCCGPISVFLY